jgi:hypothetical protein
MDLLKHLADGTVSLDNFPDHKKTLEKILDKKITTLDISEAKDRIYRDTQKLLRTIGPDYTKEFLEKMMNELL